MDIRGLTAGNWIKEVNRFDYDEREPISDLEFQIPEYASFIPYKLDYYQPIPLSEEWLLKFGFEFKEYEDFDESGDDIDEVYVEYYIKLAGKKYTYNVIINPDRTCDFGVNPQWLPEGMLIANISYVHQLQNLFHSITGEELKINSEKTVNIEP